MLPVRKLRGDWWELNEEGTILHGTRSGAAIRVGDPVRVQVERVDTAARARRPAARWSCETAEHGQGQRQEASRRRRRRDEPRRRGTASTCSTRSSAGIVLQGTEVKSLRDGGAQLKDAYATVRDGEVWLLNLHIPPYPPAYRDNHEPERDRKLLLHRREIERLVGQSQRERPDARADADLLQRPAREGRDRRSRRARTASTSARRSRSAR